MPTSINLFPTVVYKDFYPKAAELKDGLFSKLDQLFEETKVNNNIFMQAGTLCSYNTNSYLHKSFPNETSQVVEFIEEAAKKYWKMCNYHSDLTPFVFQMWANKTPKDGFVNSHLHGNMPFSAVLYVDASPEQGNLIIENPLEMVLMTQPISSDIKYPIGEEISVTSGDLVMFPGYIRHSVKPNITNTPRLILGFNIGCQGKYWANQWTYNEKN
jgi:uncharacterized protein (TIGR02466 family)